MRDARSRAGPAVGGQPREGPGAAFGVGATDDFDRFEVVRRLFFPPPRERTREVEGASTCDARGCARPGGYAVLVPVGGPAWPSPTRGYVKLTLQARDAGIGVGCWTGPGGASSSRGASNRPKSRRHPSRGPGSQPGVRRGHPQRRDREEGPGGGQEGVGPRPGRVRRSATRARSRPGAVSSPVSGRLGRWREEAADRRQEQVEVDRLLEVCREPGLERAVVIAGRGQRRDRDHRQATPAQVEAQPPGQTRIRPCPACAGRRGSGPAVAAAPPAPRALPGRHRLRRPWRPGWTGTAAKRRASRRDPPRRAGGVRRGAQDRTVRRPTHTMRDYYGWAGAGLSSSGGSPDGATAQASAMLEP